MSPLRSSRVRPLAAVCTFGVLATLSACGEGPVVSRQVPPAAVAGKKEADIDFDGDALMLVRTPSAPRGERGGTSLEFDAVLLKKNGKEHDNERHLAWTSRDTMIATVSDSGVVTAQDVGSTWLLAEYKDKDADSVKIVVRPVPVASVVIAGVDTLSVDDETTLTAAALDSVGEPLLGRTVAWSSLTPAVASVSGTGEVLGLAPGTADIAATVEGVRGEHTLRVSPQPVASVEVAPATVSVPQFHKVRFTAVAKDKRGKVLADRPVTWSSSNAGIFYIKANADTAAARELGQATVIASSEGKTGEAAVTVTNPVEARALWVTRFEFTTASAVDFAKIRTIIQKAASANFNVVYFQVRTAGDALYFSDIEPCSPRMCRTLGGARPAQDPLAVALAEAAKHGIEVHAWLNAYTGFIAGSTTACNQFIESTPRNWLKANPQWSQAARSNAGVVRRQVDNCTSTQLSSEYMYVSPGVPDVRSHLARVSADIVRRYGPLGLKGLHLDRIRFANQPGTVSGVSYTRFSYDSITQEAFRTATGAYPTGDAQLSWQNFRRGLVNQGVKEVWDSVRAVNGAFVLSAAVWPGYQSRPGWASTWSFSDLFQDPQAWAQGGYLDVEVPMIYPATTASTSWTVKPTYCASLDFTCTMDDHIQRIERTAGRHVYVGIGAIKGWAEMKAQLDLAHDRSATGVSVYSYSLIDVIPNGWAQLAAGPFKHKATLPAMSWK